MPEYEHLRAHVDDLRTVPRLRKALRAVQRDLDSLYALPPGLDADLHRRFLTRHRQLLVVQALLVSLGRPGVQRDLSRYLTKEDFRDLAQSAQGDIQKPIQETLDALGFAHRRAAFIHFGMQGILTMLGVAYVWLVDNDSTWWLGSLMVAAATVWTLRDAWAHRRLRKEADGLLRRLRAELVVRLNLMQRMQMELAGY